MIERLPASKFTYDLWDAGALYLIGCENRFDNIRVNREKIREATVGFCEADRLSVRPKPGQYAVMLWDGYEHFWTHLMASEMQVCFPELFE